MWIGRRSEQEVIDEVPERNKRSEQHPDEAPAPGPGVCAQGTGTTLKNKVGLSKASWGHHGHQKSCNWLTHLGE